MTFLDTVDGKLARCTIASSKLGNIFDHGIDLVQCGERRLVDKGVFARFHGTGGHVHMQMIGGIYHHQFHGRYPLPGRSL